MAIVKMNRIEMVGLNSERKELIEYIQHLGILDLSPSLEDGLSPRETASAISAFESDMASVLSALEVLDKYKKKEGGFFYKRPETDAYSLKSTEISDMKSLVGEILRAKRTIEENEDKICQLECEKRGLYEYLALDLPLTFSKSGTASVRVGTVDESLDEEKMWQRLLKDGIESVYFEILFSDKTHTAVWFICHNDEVEKLDKLLARLNFVKMPSGRPDEIPKKRQELIESEIQAVKIDVKELQNKLFELAKRRSELTLYYDKITLRRDKYKALSKIGISETACFITGYIPKADADRIKKDLEEKFTVFVTLNEPETDEDVPKAFENNAFVAPVEGITSDYSMPSAYDVDPNPIMAFFYYLFFGMMFSDAGYGLLMMIGCGLLGYGNFIEREKRKTYKMFFLCGASTTFWGLMYGSFFGDMIATVSKTFGSGNLALKPILFDPVQKPLELLIISVALGLLHILTALLVKLYVTWKSGDKLGAVFDTGLWITLLFGIAVFASSFAVDILIVKNIGVVMMIASAIGLVLTQGRKSKNPVMKLFGGILSLYDITSYVGDVLSYSRLMALGLATGVIATVINVLGSLGGSSYSGAILFILISLFGHALNFAINMLGAYVHTNRLQYVEFYQKFYIGGGRKYKPFGLNTKYYKFK